ncbi:putative protein Y4LL [Paramagnetospirillum caucaseum]|uniref:PAS domain-containing protein n=1 Tax=Paramagnetospirillum caucaseum TaxID=1244869 RepID=M2Z393_9PROT|nr:PAS domain-containing protein [Paramagnetospirillum caucaseum]EME68825.1 putative protein Y4LL [Paramagnetospirillum caucaseum]
MTHSNANERLDRGASPPTDSQVLAAIMDGASEGIFITGMDGIIQRVNPAFTAITGYGPEDAVGKTPGILRSHHHTAEFYRELWRGLRKDGRWQGEIWNRRKGGGVYLEWLTIRAVGRPGDEAGQYVAVFSDVSGKFAPRQTQRHQAIPAWPICGGCRPPP